MFGSVCKLVGISYRCYRSFSHFINEAIAEGENEKEDFNVC